jgi:diketogulonate reductase-like aldo/keto reductase
LTNTPSRTYTLNTGAKIPAVGLGTWQSAPNEVTSAVKAALEKGYRHIDTAAAYGNEKDVGEGIKASGVPRDQIWLTTKLDNHCHKHVEHSLKQSLENLGTDYLDLYLMHWPASVDWDDKKKIYDDWTFVDTWREMQKLLDTGKVKNIGVSNFTQANLEKLLNHPDTKVCFFLQPYQQVSTRSNKRLRSPLQSTRSSFTLATPPQSSLSTTPPRASTPLPTPASAQPTPLSTRTRSSSPSPSPRARHPSRFFSSGTSSRAVALFPRA